MAVEGKNIRALMEELRKRKEEANAGTNGSPILSPGTAADNSNSIPDSPMAVSGDKSISNSVDSIGSDILVSDLGSRSLIRPSDKANASAEAALPEAELVRSRIAELQEQLQTANPGYERQLHIIHTMLLRNQQLPHILIPSEVGIVVLGLSKKTNIIINEEKSKNKSLKNMSADDI